MLRYFHFNSKFDNNIDYTPHYTNNPKIGGGIADIFSYPLQVTTSIEVPYAPKDN